MHDEMFHSEIFKNFHDPFEIFHEIFTFHYKMTYNF